MTDLQTRIIERARVLRAETPTVALALSRATAELMPAASHDERHRVWAPLLQQHKLETVRHAVGNGKAFLGGGEHADTWRARRDAERGGATPTSDNRPTLDVSLQHGPNPFAKVVAFVKATHPHFTHDQASEHAMSLNRSHRIVA